MKAHTEMHLKNTEIFLIVLDIYIEREMTIFITFT